MGTGTTLNAIQHKLQDNLKIHLSEGVPNHSFEQVYRYSVLPPGKMFRPLLAAGVFLDINQDKQEEIQFLTTDDISKVCSSVEIHHTYTLIHDDLPAMDDDEMRRGRPSAHIQFNEWKAILSGDGLLNLSYGLLGRLKSDNLPIILRIYSWLLGPKGLIQGQVMDLGHEMTKSFENIKTTHKLKTSRLIQASLICGALCSSPDKINRKMIQNLARLGETLGLAFQFLDDLTELVEENVSKHELDVSPWIHYQDESYSCTINSITKVKEILQQYELVHTSEIVENYFSKMKKMIIEGKENIEQNSLKYASSKLDLGPIVSIL